MRPARRGDLSRLLKVSRAFKRFHAVSRGLDGVEPGKSPEKTGIFWLCCRTQNYRSIYLIILHTILRNSIADSLLLRHRLMWLENDKARHRLYTQRAVLAAARVATENGKCMRFGDSVRCSVRCAQHKLDALHAVRSAYFLPSRKTWPIQWRSWRSLYTY